MSERKHIVGKRYEKINILVQICPCSRVAKWAITLVDMKVFPKLCFNEYIFEYIVSEQNLKVLSLL